jgi:hypothetical protein
MADDKTLHGGIARAEDDRVRADLERALTEKLLARSDTGAALAREFESSVSLALPTSLEIDRAFEQGPSTVPSNQDVQSLLSLDNVGEISVGEMKLNDLLARGGASLEDRAVLKPGLLFLSRRLYAEARDWWLLKRPEEPYSNPRLYCLTTLLLAFTYQLSGDTAHSQEAIEEARKIRPLV